MYSGKYGYVYEVTNKVNGMKYIGKCVVSRKNNHLTYLGSGVYLKRAINKYGKQNFKKEVLEFAEDELQLRVLEEKYIKERDAVESKNYYNLKYTSIGGDTFTNNQNKELIRKKMSENARGSKNPNYGKKASDLCKKRLKESNSKAIKVRGIVYESITEASDLLGEGITTIHYRLRSSNYAEYTYIDEEYHKKVGIKKDKKPGQKTRKPVNIDGVSYESVSQFVRETGVANTTAHRRLKSPHFTNYKYI